MSIVLQPICFSTPDHQNADALSRLTLGEDEFFDEEEGAGDVDIVCATSSLGFQMETPDPSALQKETARDAILPYILRFTRERWQQKSNNNNIDVEKYRKLADSLSAVG